MATATVAPPSLTAAAQTLSLPHVAWETYERLLADDEERRSPRLTYDRGVLEIVSPSLPHETDALTLARIVDSVSVALNIPVLSVGATTFRRPDLERGFEADGSFYIANEPRMRGRREVDLLVDPPPDLVIEMEISRSAIDKLTLFAAMGVPEVWRSAGGRVAIVVLEGETYRQVPGSHALPPLTGEILARFLAESHRLPSPQWSRLISDWAAARPGGSQD